MKNLYVAMTAGTVALSRLAYWKNRFSYSFKSANWRLGKSTIDFSIVALSALYLPALSVGWTVVWLAPAWRASIAYNPLHRIPHQIIKFHARGLALRA